MRTLHFQDLRPNFTSVQPPSILPELRYIKYINYNDYLISLQSWAVGLHRKASKGQSRVSQNAKVEKSIYLNAGDLLKAQSSISASYYDSKKLFYDYTFTASWQRPIFLINNAIEPVIKVSFAQNNMDGIKNEDSQAPELSSHNVLAVKKFAGQDIALNGWYGSYEYVAMVD